MIIIFLALFLKLFLVVFNYCFYLLSKQKL